MTDMMMYIVCMTYTLFLQLICVTGLEQDQGESHINKLRRHSDQTKISTQVKIKCVKKRYIYISFINNEQTKITPSKVSHPVGNVTAFSL